MKTFGLGRLTRDPECSTYGEGGKLARFSIACDKRWKREGQPTADFFNCVAFGKLAEFVENYFKKGTKIMVTGRLENNNYVNKDGVKINAVQISCEEIEFAESKNANNNSNVGNKVDNDFMTVPETDDEELPF